MKQKLPDQIFVFLSQNLFTRAILKTLRYRKFDCERMDLVTKEKWYNYYYIKIVEANTAYE